MCLAASAGYVLNRIGSILGIGKKFADVFEHVGRRAGDAIERRDDGGPVDGADIDLELFGLLQVLRIAVNGEKRGLQRLHPIW